MPATITTTLLCTHCHRPLGETDGRRLYLGAVACDRAVTLGCVHCGARRVWRPEVRLDQRLTPSVQ